jgi:hypothetical protein
MRRKRIQRRILAFVAQADGPVPPLDLTYNDLLADLDRGKLTWRADAQTDTNAADRAA